MIINPYQFAGGGGGATYEYGIETLGSLSAISRTQQVGWSAVMNATRSCAGLRLYLQSAGADEVLRLWDKATETLVDSVTVTPVSGAWVEGLFSTPVSLTSGSEYLMTCRRADGSSRSTSQGSSGFTYNSDISKVALGAVLNNTDGYPGQVASGSLLGVPDLILEAP